ncbi:sodium-independent anion transporter [Labilibaculum filiforme]|uniref:Sodium-independent anion transporter n=1 Tax=Labilibaculum filiforme TaxID=1940526 RepID=A0A2N3I0P6_9BACT|nr:sulfate permease [Labilibaculum filiforme]PKQ63837.1 sodium-independent anion transporter [Labilibaculum filiforme]
MNSIFKPKLFTVLKDYNFQAFQKDLFAGIIVGIVALPLAIAFAVASGVSPEKGLITAIIAGFLISLLGGSRVQIGGPTGAFIVIVYGIVNQYGIDGLMISTFLAGVILILFGVLRMGAVLKFIPHPLIVGFTSGIALVIFSTQIKAAFGLDLAEVPSEFLAKWACYFANISSLNISAVIISGGTILLTLFSGKLIPKIPGSFIAIIAMTALVQIFGLQVDTIESVYGSIPNTFSFDMPTVDWTNLPNYFQPAITIAILGAIESLLSAVVADGMIGGNHRSNTELIAQGIANIFSPIFGGIPATGAIARTATNVKNGGRTPVAGIIHAFTLLLIMLVFGQWAKLIPMSCLAGILIVVSYNMSEWRSFRSILKGTRFDTIVLLTTFFLTVLVDLTIAIEMGIVLSSLIFMYRMSKINGIIPLESESDEIQNYNQIPKQIEIYEISGPFFFAAAKRYQETLRDLKSSTSILIIRMRHVPFMDTTGVRNFIEIIKDLKIRKTKVILSGVNSEVLKELQNSEIHNLISEEFIFNNFDEALEVAKKSL